MILIAPGHDAEQWDGNEFIKPCKCEITAMDGKLPVKAVFEVNVCFEGIGTAFLNTPHYSSPQEILIPCDANERIREDKAFALPLTVMVWNPDTRTLEPDTAAIKALSMEVTLMQTSTMKPGSDAFKKLQTMVEEAKIALCETANTVEIDPKLSPEIFGLRATGKTAKADIELMLTFKCELPQIADLTLKAKTSNSMDYKAMIRWLIEYPAGSYASQFIALGDVNTYYKALDHLDGVYQYDKTPNLAKGFRHRSNENYYEHGKGDITRDTFIALHVLPTGIGDLEGIILLYHELTHTLEDILLDERDGTPATGCERNAELLKELARALHNLCDAEKDGADTIGHIRKAIECLSVGVNHQEV
ncbi:MAG: hypothetical protein GX044_01090 [Firmicutes bacterium]|nr:hypothetical protein [Bacillota bacterium]